MSENYFRVDAVERIWASGIQTHGIKKERRGQGNYQEAAKAAEMCKKGKETEEKEHSAKDGNDMALCSPGIRRGMINNPNISLVERQEQRVFQKKIQESKAQRIRMMAAYGGGE